MPEDRLARNRPGESQPAHNRLALAESSQPREAAELIIDALPSMPEVARWARRFLVDAVYQLVSVFGIRQFPDIGSGFPTADNTHEVA